MQCMEVRELRCFVRVAETLSFKRAAELLNVSQSVATKTIAQLEHKIGVKLFTRTTRRVALTPAGVLLKREASDLIRHLDQVQRAVRHETGEQSGRFVIGVIPLAMQTIFPQIIRDFRKRFPDIEMEIREMPTETQVKGLLSAQIDLAFLLAPISEPEIRTEVLYEQEMRLAVPSDHPHMKPLGGCQVPLSAFAGDTFVVPARTHNPNIHDEIYRVCQIAGFRPRIQECQENQSCLSLVEAGMGVCFVTNESEVGLRGGLSLVALEAPTPVLNIAMAWRKEDPSAILDTIKVIARGKR